MPAMPFASYMWISSSSLPCLLVVFAFAISVLAFAAIMLVVIVLALAAIVLVVSVLAFAAIVLAVSVLAFAAIMLVVDRVL